MSTALLTLACVGLLLWAWIEHRRRVRVEADLHDCVRCLGRALDMAKAFQDTAHMSPLILAQAQRMQDAQDETDAHRAKGGRAR